MVPAKPALAAVSASLVLALVVGVAGITWNWREAVLQRGLAAAERDQKEAQRCWPRPPRSGPSPRPPRPTQ